MDTPYALVSHEVTGSTQDDARALYRGAPVLVTAQRQTVGRGRRGATWETAPRALAASLAFSTDWPAETWSRIPLMAGLSLLPALPGNCELKWPNDVVVGYDKAAGILVEGSDGLVVVGVGVNLWWPDAPPGYAGIYEEDCGEEQHVAIARDWAERLLGALSGDPELWGRDEYRRVCGTLGKSITWEPAGAGTAIDVDRDGALLVRTGSGVQRLVSGSVWEVRGFESSS